MYTGLAVGIPEGLGTTGFLAWGWIYQGWVGILGVDIPGDEWVYQGVGYTRDRYIGTDI